MSVFAFAVLCASSLLTIIDPIAAAPLFVAITAGQDEQSRRRTAIRACLVAGGLLTVFAVAGGAIFGLFGITIHAFRIAGGILFFTMAMPMLTGRTNHSSADVQSGDDPAIVPLGMPIIAGPGAISTVMVLMGQAEGITQVIALHLAIVATVGLTAVALWLAPVLMP